MGVKIAIIDTGVDDTHPWLEGCVSGGIGIVETDESIQYVSSLGDILGHGTSVASIVHAFCPDASLYAVRVLETVNNRIKPEVSEAKLAAAINWCLTENIRIVNLSYSMESADSGLLQKACDSAHSQGYIIVGSYRSDGKCYFPAGFSSVLGVRWSKKCRLGEVIVMSENNNDVATWGGPLDVAYKSGAVAHLKGASYACSTITAMVGRMRQVDPEINMREVIENLRRLEMKDKKEVNIG